MYAPTQSTTVTSRFRGTLGTKTMPHKNVGQQFSFEERIFYLREYGSHCMSYSALQPGMQYFDVPGKGYIAYINKWWGNYVLGDPVCDAKDRQALIGEFLLHHNNSAFIQISEPVAELLHEEFGYYGTQFGIESIIYLDNWDLKGKKKQVLRTSVNQARKKGIYFKENYNEYRHDQLSEEWMKTRKVKGREIGFLIRPMNMDYQDGTRKFCAYLGGELIGFIFFDPIYSQNKVIGYAPNISRFSNTFKQGIFYSLMIHAIDTFKNEGIKQINLGLSICAVDGQDDDYESNILKNIIRLLYKYGNKVYSFKGIHFTKSRFQGEEFKTFCSHKRKLPIKHFTTIFKLTNVI